MNEYDLFDKSAYLKMSNDRTLLALSGRRMFLARAKLKASSRTSALLSGFAMVAMVEIDIDKETSTGLLVAYSIITTLVVAVHLLALLISTCILPHIEATEHTDSPHEKLSVYINMAWMLSTGIGILLFLVQMALLAWVRFNENQRYASIASTIIIAPVFVIFVAFAFVFYRKLVTHKYEQSAKGLEELEDIISQLGRTQQSARPAALQIV